MKWIRDEQHDEWYAEVTAKMTYTAAKDDESNQITLYFYAGYDDLKRGHYVSGNLNELDPAILTYTSLPSAYWYPDFATACYVAEQHFVKYRR